MKITKTKCDLKVCNIYNQYIHTTVSKYKLVSSKDRFECLPINGCNSNWRFRQKLLKIFF